MKNVNLDFNNNSLNALIIQKQSQHNTAVSNTFSSLMNKTEDKEIKQKPSENLSNQQMELQTKAYLNKLILGLAA